MPEQANKSARRVLVTGAYGLIGNAVYERFAGEPERYDAYGLDRQEEASERLRAGRVFRIPRDRFVAANIADAGVVCRAAGGMDAVVHLAANPDGGGGWESVLSSNIVGVYNVLEACRRGRVKRVVLASTIQVVYGYCRNERYCAIMERTAAALPPGVAPLGADHAPRPLSLYAASKAWTEALAHVYAYEHGLSCLCVRIGWVPRGGGPPCAEAYPVWCSRRDIVALIERCVAAPAEVRYDIFYGVSNNAGRWVDIEHARARVGYEPRDRSETYQAPADRKGGGPAAEGGRSGRRE